MGRRRTHRAFPPSLEGRISVSRRQRGAFLYWYVAVPAAHHGCSNVFLHTSSPARPLSSQMAAPSRSESGLEVATRCVRIWKRTRSSHSSARPHRLTSSIPNPSHPPQPSLTPYDLVLPLRALPATRRPSTPPRRLHSIPSSPSARHGAPAHSCQLTGPLCGRPAPGFGRTADIKSSSPS